MINTCVWSVIKNVFCWNDTQNHDATTSWKETCWWKLVQWIIHRHDINSYTFKTLEKFSSRVSIISLMQSFCCCLRLWTLFLYICNKIFIRGWRFFVTDYGGFILMFVHHHYIGCLESYLYIREDIIASCLKMIWFLYDMTNLPKTHNSISMIYGKMERLFMLNMLISIKISNIA